MKIECSMARHAGSHGHWTLKEYASCIWQTLTEETLQLLHTHTAAKQPGPLHHPVAPPLPPLSHVNSDRRKEAVHQQSKFDISMEMKKLRFNVEYSLNGICKISSIWQISTGSVSSTWDYHSIRATPYWPPRHLRILPVDGFSMVSGCLSLVM